ncbi:hypothetical protein ALC56_02430, partial [Trachymyrmex septentrionalis]
RVSTAKYITVFVCEETFVAFNTDCLTCLESRYCALAELFVLSTKIRQMTIINFRIERLRRFVPFTVVVTIPQLSSTGGTNKGLSVFPCHGAGIDDSGAGAPADDEDTTRSCKRYIYTVIIVNFLFKNIEASIDDLFPAKGTSSREYREFTIDRALGIVSVQQEITREHGEVLFNQRRK